MESDSDSISNADNARDDSIRSSTASRSQSSGEEGDGGGGGSSSSSERTSAGTEHTYEESYHSADNIENGMHATPTPETSVTEHQGGLDATVAERRSTSTVRERDSNAAVVDSEESRLPTEVNETFTIERYATEAAEPTPPAVDRTRRQRIRASQEAHLIMSPQAFQGPQPVNELDTANLPPLSERACRALVRAGRSGGGEATPSREGTVRSRISGQTARDRLFAQRLAEVEEEPTYEHLTHLSFRSLMAARSSAKTSTMTISDFLDDLLQKTHSEGPVSERVYNLMKERVDKLANYLDQWEQLKERAILEAPEDQYYRKHPRKLEQWMEKEIHDFTTYETSARALIAECNSRIQQYDNEAALTLAPMDVRNMIESGFRQFCSYADTAVQGSTAQLIAAAAKVQPIGAAMNTKVAMPAVTNVSSEPKPPAVITVVTSSSSETDAVSHSSRVAAAVARHQPLPLSTVSPSDPKLPRVNLAQVAIENRIAAAHAAALAARDGADVPGAPQAPGRRNRLSLSKRRADRNNTSDVESIPQGLDTSDLRADEGADDQLSLTPLQQQEVLTEDESSPKFPSKTTGAVRKVKVPSYEERKTTEQEAYLLQQLQATEEARQKLIKNNVKLQKEMASQKSIIKDMCANVAKGATLKSIPGVSSTAAAAAIAAYNDGAAAAGSQRRAVYADGTVAEVAGGGPPPPEGGSLGSLPEWIGTAVDKLCNSMSKQGTPQSKKFVPKMKPVQLGKFAGDCTKFASFWKNFYSLVHSNPDMDMFYKHNQLVQCLELNSEAYNSVVGMVDQPDLYLEMVEHLKDTFGNRRLLVTTLFRRLFFYPQATMKDGHDLIHFLENTLQKLRAQKINVEEPTVQLVMLSIFESKLPGEICLAWERHQKAWERKQPRVKATEEEFAPPAVFHFKIIDFMEFVKDRFSTSTSAVYITKGGQQGETPKPQQQQQQKGNGGGKQQNQPQKAQGNDSPKKNVQVASTMGGNQPNQQKDSPEKKRNGQWKRKLFAFVEGVEAGEDLTVLVGNARGPKSSGKGPGGSNQPAPKQGGSASAPPPQKQQPQADKHKFGCLFCGGNHHPMKCGKAKDMPVMERWAKMRSRMRDELMCVSCFEPGHKSTTCDKGCGVSGCLRRHATILHMDYPPNASQ